jgi:hypothetical protein
VKHASRTRLIGISVGLMIAVATGVPALASLGADVNSIESDRVSMKGQLRVTSTGGYSVHEIQTPTNTLVREYIATNGKVFAVSWKGPLMPNLRETLGSFFAQYQAATMAPHAKRRQLSIEQPDLIVHSSGHMRAFSGQAFIPSLAPANFSLADIK